MADTVGTDRPVKRRGPAKRVTRKWTASKERRFFETLAITANVAHSARSVGLTGESAHARRRENPAFAARWMAALEQGYGELETALLCEAIGGTERTETVSDADGTVRQRKTVHSVPHGLALRLLAQHRETVARFRTMKAMADGGDEGDVAERVRAEMARVRARLDGSEQG
ncbi:MAG: hypothetical protein ABW184_10955 [Sphingobium sp.]